MKEPQPYHIFHIMFETQQERVWKLQFVFWYYISSLDTFNTGEQDLNKRRNTLLTAASGQAVITSTPTK